MIEPGFRNRLNLFWFSGDFRSADDVVILCHDAGKDEAQLCAGWQIVADFIEQGEQHWQTPGMVDGYLLLLVAHAVLELETDNVLRMWHAKIECVMT